MWSSISYVNYSECETYIYTIVGLRYFNVPLLRIEAFSIGKTKTSSSLVCVLIKKKREKFVVVPCIIYLYYVGVSPCFSLLVLCGPYMCCLLFLVTLCFSLKYKSGVPVLISCKDFSFQLYLSFLKFFFLYFIMQTVHFSYSGR
jgi:hypothetical protein